MTFTLVSHQWRAFWRSRSAGKNLAAQIFIGFLVLYLLGCALFLGLSLQYFLPHFFPGQDIIRVFCGLILYYFSFDILMRFMLQELPILSIQPYLAQNIRRSQLVRFLNVRSLFHFLNLIPLFIFIPFIIGVIGTAHGPLVAVCFIISVLAITLFNHFLILYIKRKIIVNSWWLVGFLGAVGVLIALDYFHVFSFRAVSTSLFTSLLQSPWLCLAFVVLGLGCMMNNSRFLRKNLYFEEIARRGRQRQSTEYTWLQQWGVTGELVALNIRLILRNKRTKAVVLMGCVILLYGFIFYKPVYMKSEHMPMILLAAMFITGIFIMNYGQFLFAWHSGYFDGLMSLPISIREFIRAQFMLFITVSALTFVVSSLYGLISWKIIPFQLAAFLYNIGINTVVVVYFATRSYKAIDLNRSATFNYQGTGMSQWINVLLALLLPMLVYCALAWAFNDWVGLTVLGLLGFISLLLQNWWINLLTGQFQARKHTILAGFREK
jgi:Family of unknown function (DUF5687)